MGLAWGSEATTSASNAAEPSVVTVTTVSPDCQVAQARAPSCR